MGGILLFSSILVATLWFTTLSSATSMRFQTVSLSSGPARTSSDAAWLYGIRLEVEGDIWMMEAATASSH